MSDQKNFILAITLSLGIFLGWDYFFGVKNIPVQQVTVEEPQQIQGQSQPVEKKESLSETLVVLDRNEALKDQRVHIETPALKGSINLKGGKLDDLVLLNYKTSLQDESSLVTLLNPRNTKDFYYVDFTVLTDEGIESPDENTQWALQEGHDKLTPTTPVTLIFQNGQGVRFERTYSIDENYMISISQKIINDAKGQINIQQKALINRYKPNLEGSTYILHEGAIGYMNGRLSELSYDKLSENKNQEASSKGGWIGFSDKYWLVALIPHQDAQSLFDFKADKNNQFFTTVKMDRKVLNPGEAVEQGVQLYAGPKKLSLLDSYEEKFSINKLDLAIDFGMFYFLTKPLFQFLDWLYQLFGNFGIAILIMTLVSKIILFPLANKSYYSMGRMKNLSPKMEQIKAKYGQDPTKMQQEMMALYKKEKVNPLSGCLPMLIQAPIFFCLYKVLYISIEMRHAPFFGWIHDLSAPDPTSLFNLFGLIPFDPPSFLMIGILPILMGATMIIQQKLNPQPVDPTQAKMMMFMPIFFTYIFASFPSGLVLYWTFSNVLSIIQQKIIMEIASKKEGKK
jgi:YidC/Oxa1 family membrane protein insertase